jgi:hypothetical protein
MPSRARGKGGVDDEVTNEVENERGRAKQVRDGLFLEKAFLCVSLLHDELV